jgi:acetylornithine deacetylase
MAEKLEAEVGNAIRREIESAFDEQIAFTREMVRFPSLRGQVGTVQDFVARALRERGYAVDRWTVDPKEIEHHEGFSPVAVSYEQAINVVGTHRPASERGRSLVVNGHVDVVPPGPLDMWARPPFDPEIEGDWLYGRGAGDMKAGVAAAIFALDAIRRAGWAPAATVHLESVCEEESTGNGALACLLRGYKGDAALIPEPTGGTVTRANVGVLWFRIHVRGRPAHVAYAPSGANAIGAAYKLVQALAELEMDLNARRTMSFWLKDHPHPININVGKIEGGDWASSVPAWCVMDVRAAFYPEMDPAQVQQEIASHLMRASADDPFLAENPPTIEWNGFRVRGYVLEPGSEAEATLAEAHKAVTGQPLQDAVMPAYLDARVFALYADMPALNYGPTAENIHGFDERVSLASIEATTKAMALFIAKWCGLERR